MTSKPKFILRVDDVGWNPPDKTKDEGLAYFSRWRKALGIGNSPAYYGVIPKMIDVPELNWLRENLGSNEELAVHGWDHEKGKRVTQFQMESARTTLERHSGRCRSYIPPFNSYSHADMEAWGNVCPRGFFFGGFGHREDGPVDHSLGQYPLEIHNTWHIPATRQTYDHSRLLVSNLERWESVQCPVVVTLHCTWDYEYLNAVRTVGEIIKPYLVPADEVISWSERIALDRKALTAPHFLAYSWILERLSKLPLGQSVLDFGARYSVLPSHMALRGHRVTAIDRDPKVVDDQQSISRRYGVELDSTHVSDILEWSPDQKFDVITVVWALQHNSIEYMHKAAEKLGGLLVKGGKILVVSSYTPDSNSFYQENRPDPQWVLNESDHRLMMGMFGLYGMNYVPKAVDYFYYEHGTDVGKSCEKSKANAICYELEKPL